MLSSINFKGPIMQVAAPKGCSITGKFYEKKKKKEKKC